MFQTRFLAVRVRGVLLAAAFCSAVPVWAVVADARSQVPGDKSQSSLRPPHSRHCASVASDETPIKGTITGGLDCQGLPRTTCSLDHL